MFGVKYSRLKFWIISIILFIIAIPILIAKNILKDSVNADTILIIAVSGILVSAIWMNTLANRIRDYGDNPWVALFSIVPLANIGLALYYGIAKSNVKEIAKKNDSNSLASAVYNHSKDIINGIKPAINEYKETHTLPNNDSQNNNTSIDESKIYEDIMIEIEQDNKVKSTWAKALSQSDGNRDKLESLYIKMRFDEIKEEYIKNIQLVDSIISFKNENEQEFKIKNIEEVNNDSDITTIFFRLIAVIIILGTIVYLNKNEIYTFFNIKNSTIISNKTSLDSTSNNYKDDLYFKADITDLVLNLTDSTGKEKLMKLSFSMKSSEPTIAAIVEESKAEIIDVVITQISSRSSEELLTGSGKNLLRDEVLQDINNVINEVTKSRPEVKKNNIKQILFTTFVIK